MRKFISALIGLLLLLGVSSVLSATPASASGGTLSAQTEIKRCDTVRGVCFHIRVWVSGFVMNGTGNSMAETWVFCRNIEETAYVPCRAINTMNASLIEVDPNGGTHNRYTHVGPTCSSGGGGTIGVCPLEGITVQTPFLTAVTNGPTALAMVYGLAAASGSPADLNTFVIGCCLFPQTKQVFWG